MGTQLRLDQWPRRPCTKTCKLALGVQVQELVHAAQIEGEYGALADRAVEVPGHTGATRVGDHDPVFALRQVQQFAYLRTAFHIGHAVGQWRQLARATANPVAVTLA